MDSTSGIGNQYGYNDYGKSRKKHRHEKGSSEGQKDEVTLSGQVTSGEKDRVRRGEKRGGKHGGGPVEDRRYDGQASKSREEVPTTMAILEDEGSRRPGEVKSNRPKPSSHGAPITDLKVLADNALQQRGLLTDFSPEVMSQVKGITRAAEPDDPKIRDLRSLPWCSIDNDDSKDLDQLTVSQKLPNGDVKILVAIADVDALVPKDSPIDGHARQNTTSIYTPDKKYPMLPDKLSTDFTSLNPDVDRLAIVIEYTVDKDGNIKDPDIYRANVHNHAKLAYNSCAQWLDGNGPMPEAAKAGDMEDQLRTQLDVAQKLKGRRHENGSLTLETIEPETKVVDGKVLDLEVAEKNCAKEMIEDFMVAANGVVARFLEKSGSPSLMRVVKTPKKWDRIVAIAQEKGVKLPAEPDAVALEKFLAAEKQKDPLHFPDLSLSVVKSMGRGEYVVNRPGVDDFGHFALAVKDYAHSTAPNRRYPDLITQREIKAALDGKPCPYSIEEMEELATHCTEQENNADKAERQARKSATALFLSDKIGQSFDGIVTGASEKGTWVRVLKPPAEGQLVQGQKGLDVGDRVRVKLQSVNVEKGFIDFVRDGGKKGRH